ncbi:hypothetical protein THASP1DRAFT_32165 [Thamnocephalis sphaerospora]|uniref:Uncharacterized protein n=1 Tax=Thamnocephalis sphaerospora TaxID=78915 RepID=A0A4P9XKP7_9FUNG|nr:hypothetical protein THASP1DRAFT_32165 [Thamnocephalis sphaerospora]|eukprot:RKP06011.1 hypothetical protein THASP1DRAFT_32165 [Thamnocephalis sphaerospora]
MASQAVLLSPAIASQRRSGIAISLPLQPDECNFAIPPLNISQSTALQSTAHQATRHTDTGLIVAWSLARESGCATIASIIHAANIASAGLESIGFPPITYVALLASGARTEHAPPTVAPANQSIEISDPDDLITVETVPAWGPMDPTPYGNLNAVLDATPYHSVSLALLDAHISIPLQEAAGSADYFLFSATDDVGPWNAWYLGRAYTFTRNLLAMILLSCFLAQCFRLCWHGFSKTLLSHGPRVVALLTGILMTPAAIVAAIWTASPHTSPLGEAAIVLSRVAFIILLWQAMHQIVRALPRIGYLMLRAYLICYTVMQLSIAMYRIVAATRFGTRIAAANSTHWARSADRVVRYMALVDSAAALSVFTVFSVGGWLFGRTTGAHLVSRSIHRRFAKLIGVLFSAVLLSGADLYTDLALSGLLFPATITIPQAQFQDASPMETATTRIVTLIWAADALAIVVLVARLLITLLEAPCSTWPRRAHCRLGR